MQIQKRTEKTLIFHLRLILIPGTETSFNNKTQTKTAIPGKGEESDFHSYHIITSKMSSFHSLHSMVHTEFWTWTKQYK